MFFRLMWGKRIDPFHVNLMVISYKSENLGLKLFIFCRCCHCRSRNDRRAVIALAHTLLAQSKCFPPNNVWLVGYTSPCTFDEHPMYSLKKTFLGEWGLGGYEEPSSPHKSLLTSFWQLLNLFHLVKPMTVD